eukprot:15438492-Alexandrium_andersonii.AAC.1
MPLAIPINFCQRDLNAEAQVRIYAPSMSCSCSRLSEGLVASWRLAADASKVRHVRRTSEQEQEE